jgi:hypothetical protein
VKNRWLFLLGSLVCASLLLAAVQPVQADVAPPQPPPGSNLSPGQEITNVRMVEETVILEVQPGLTALFSQSSAVRDWAKVKASFIMRNLSNQPESMQTLFPLGNYQGWGDGWGGVPEIQNFKVWADKVPLKVTRVMTASNPSMNISDTPWAGFDITYPAGKDVLIEVTYDVIGYGYPPSADFQYILETGAGWNGTIGKADLIVRLPYDVSSENTFLEDCRPAGCKASGREISWHLENIEPTDSDNLSISVIEPYLYQDVLTGRLYAKGNPEDGNAWGNLARALKKTILTAKGYLMGGTQGEKIYLEAVDAYEKAVKLAPKEARWHAGYAELLFRGLGWSYDLGDTRALRAAQELHAALVLDPENQQALDLELEFALSNPDMIRYDNGSYTYKVLTATYPPTTPTPYETYTPEVQSSLTASATLTQPASPTYTQSAQVASTTGTAEPALQQPSQTPMPAPNQPDGGNPLCSGALLAPASVLIAVILKSKLIPRR